MNIYIATPVNARSEKSFRDKYRAARQRCEEIKKVLLLSDDFRDFCTDTVCMGKAEGCNPIFVTTFDVNGQDDCPYTEADAMGSCIAAVIEADAIVLDRGWTKSNGCLLEYQAATIYGKRIYEYDKL